MVLKFSLIKFHDGMFQKSAKKEDQNPNPQNLNSPLVIPKMTAHSHDRPSLPATIRQYQQATFADVNGV
jgi:hypothetical protein